MKQSVNSQRTIKQKEGEDLGKLLRRCALVRVSRTNSPDTFVWYAPKKKQAVSRLL
jgi:hypothetical protein